MILTPSNYVNLKFLPHYFSIYPINNFTFHMVYGILLWSSRSGGMADALASGASGSNIVWVQVPSSA